MGLTMNVGNGSGLVLHDVLGLGEEFTLLDGVDQDGKVWVYHRQNGDYTCSLCGERLRDGWLCFNDGNVVCAMHVTIAGKIE